MNNEAKFLVRFSFIKFWLYDKMPGVNIRKLDIFQTNRSWSKSPGVQQASY